MKVTVKTEYEITNPKIIGWAKENPELFQEAVDLIDPKFKGGEFDINMFYTWFLWRYADEKWGNVSFDIDNWKPKPKRFSDIIHDWIKDKRYDDGNSLIDYIRERYGNFEMPEPKKK